MFTRVRWREGYDIDEVNAFLERLAATVEGRYVDSPVTVADIRNVSFTPVRFREGYSVDEVDAFLDQAAQALTNTQPGLVGHGETQPGVVGDGETEPGVVGDGEAQPGVVGDR